MSRQTISLHWEVPVLAESDVCVVGGGSAGVAAAVAASRAGAQVILVEACGYLGGTSTAGLVGPLMTSYSSDGSQQVIGGIFQEVVDLMVVLDGAIDPSQVEGGTAFGAFIQVGHARLTPCSPEALKLATMQIVEKTGCRVMFHTSFLQAHVDKNQVTGIVLHNKAGLGIIKAKVFVDTSGDADVASSAGVPFTVGRIEDGRMMPATMFMRLGNVNDDEVQAWADAHPKEALFESIVQQARKEERWVGISREYLNLYREPEPGVYRANITRLLGIDGTNPDDLSWAEMEGRRQCLQVFRFMRENCPGLKNAKLLETASRIGIRETRHIHGLYTLTGEDVVAGSQFPDAIARCAYPIDIHDPLGKRHVDIPLGNQLKQSLSMKPNTPLYYEIPYRCLVPENLENLLVAGRPISATHEGAASARVIPPCYATGQAAGLAAALSVKTDCRVPNVDPAKLQERLREQGAIV